MILITNIVRSLIVFLVSLLVVATIGLAWWFAVFPAVLCFIILHHFDSGKNPYKMIEAKYSELADKLSAGKDTLDEEHNVFAADLHQELKQDLRNVTITSFIDAERLRKDFLFLGLLALVIVIIAPFNPALFSASLSPADLVSLITDSEIFGSGNGVSREGDGAEGSGAGGAVNEDIFGDKKIAILGDEDLNVRLALGEDSFDFSSIKKVQKFEFKAVYPDEIGATGSSSFEENIPKEQQEIVKNYYKKLAEE